MACHSQIERRDLEMAACIGTSGPPDVVQARNPRTSPKADPKNRSDYNGEKMARPERFERPTLRFVV